MLTSTNREKWGQHGAEDGAFAPRDKPDDRAAASVSLAEASKQSCVRRKSSQAHFPLIPTAAAPLQKLPFLAPGFVLPLSVFLFLYQIPLSDGLHYGNQYSTLKAPLASIMSHGVAGKPLTMGRAPGRDPASDLELYVLFSVAMCSPSSTFNHSQPRCMLACQTRAVRNVRR